MPLLPEAMVALPMAAVAQPVGARTFRLMTPGTDPSAERRIFRRTVVKVFAVQIVTLALLWLLQTRYHP